MLLTDGRVLVQANPNPGAGISAADFYTLTPDASGDYAHGTWRKVASPPAGYSPWATSESVLSDGRVLLAGGEYNHDEYQLPFSPNGLTNMSAVYNPVTDQWTMIPAPAGMDYMGEPAAVTLPDGRFLIGDKLAKKMWAFDPAANQWSAVSFTGYPSDDFAEMGFTLLPSGAVLTVDVRNAPQSYHFLPATGTWVSDGATATLLAEAHPQALTYGPAPQQTVGGISYGPAPAGVYQAPGEIGPSMLRPDGTVFWAGASATAPTHTAVYHPGATPAAAGSWTAGPDIPNGDDADDASAVLLVNGNVLLAGKSDALYEFNGTSFTRTIPPPANSFGTFLLPLPSGQVLVLTPGQTLRARLYTTNGGPQAGWAPTITSVPSAVTRGQTYSLTGTQLNGLSEAAAYGDEFTAATNYPLVRITNVATGHVFYARTHGHPRGVATGATPVTTMFDVSATAETGASTLVVVANGIASASVNVTVS